jgi:hypothetical protein
VQSFRVADLLAVATPWSLLPRAALTKSFARQQTLQEQREVEQYFITGGYLYPTYHFAYWMGLSTSSVNWPSFKWLDAQSRPPLSRGSSLVKPYTHWVGSARALPGCCIRPAALLLPRVSCA